MINKVKDLFLCCTSEKSSLPDFWFFLKLWKKSPELDLGASFSGSERFWTKNCLFWRTSQFQIQFQPFEKRARFSYNAKSVALCDWEYKSQCESPVKENQTLLSYLHSRSSLFIMSRLGVARQLQGLRKLQLSNPGKFLPPRRQVLTWPWHLNVNLGFVSRCPKYRSPSFSGHPLVLRYFKWIRLPLDSSLEQFFVVFTFVEPIII